MLHGDPPLPGLELECRLAITEYDALDVLSLRTRCAVESAAQASGRIDLTPRRVRRMSAELRAQRGRASARPVTCLTSARGNCDTTHECVVVTGVRRRTSVPVRQSLRLAVERVTLALEGAIQ